MDKSVSSLAWAGDSRDLLVLILRDGSSRIFPKSSIEVVSKATEEDVTNVEILGDGEYLHWPSLNFDLHVPALLDGISGSAAWMAALGRQGGLARTDRKAAAARHNGRLGGRPRKLKVKVLLAGAEREPKIQSIRASTSPCAWRFSFDSVQFASALMLPADSPSPSIPRLR